MNPPTESDLSLLRVIVTLAESHGGRPPTFSEIAVAAGMQSSSRGNVQRQLSRLRGQYVEWGSGARSITLTPSGLALVRGTTSAHIALQQPIQPFVLQLLASGLMKLTQDIAEGQPSLAPYPDAWQRGLNILALECLRRGVEAPSHTQAAITWCKKPLDEWPVQFALQTRILDQPLLEEDDTPTAFCRELSEQIAHGNAEHELCENLMRKIRDQAELHRNQAAYVAFRSFVIRHPVVFQEELIDAASSVELGIFGRHLFEFYEAVPASVIEHDRVRLCGHCGWTLERYDERTRCAGDFCAVITAGFTRNTATLAVPVSGSLRRVRQAIRQYIVAPGRYEIELFDALQSAGIEVDLWPDYDAYDLHIVVGDQALAIDIKDWTYAHLLAAKLIPFRTDTSRSWTQAYYAVPDIRARDPAYLAYLRTVTAGEPFKIETISAVRRMVTDPKRGNHA